MLHFMFGKVAPVKYTMNFLTGARCDRAAGLVSIQLLLLKVCIIGLGLYEKSCVVHQPNKKSPDGLYG